MSKGATARLFVAIDPPLEVREELAAWARLLAADTEISQTGRRAPRGARSAMRPLAADSLHLTLCFLGPRPVGEIEALSACLGACTASVGELSVGAPLLLPPRHPRALAVEIHESGSELAALQARVVDAIAGASDWEPSGRGRFRAHVTVARMHADAAWTLAGRSLAPTPRLSFTPRTIGLYRSWLEPSGASYESLASYELVTEPERRSGLSFRIR
jgi:2'-5' RNA ligase